MKRVLVVPWSIAPAKSAITPPSSFSLSPQGVGSRPHQHPRGCRARILVPGAPFAEVTRATLAGDERDRRLHALLGRRGGRGERLPEGGAVFDGAVQRISSGCERVEHRLVAELGLATRADALDAGADH